MPVSHYSLSQKQKQALSSFTCPSLIAASWLWRTQPCLSCTQCENPSISANFSSPVPNTSPSVMMCSKLCKKHNSSFNKLQRVRCSFYPTVVQCSLKPIKGKETKSMFAKIKLKPSSDGVTAIYAHMGCLPRMFLI